VPLEELLVISNIPAALLCRQVVGPQLAVHFDRAHQWVEDPTTSAAVKEYMDDLLQRPISIFFLILTAMDQNQV